MDASLDTQPDQGTAPAAGGRLRPVAKIVILYIGLPLGAYYLMRSAGLTSVTALLLSGVFPAAGVAAGAVRQHRLDVVGALVLAGILLGTVLGLVTHSAKPVLALGSVPTGVFGVACLISLTRRPLMFGLALEFTGPDSDRGREMTTLWQYDGFRRIFRVITAVWGIAFLIEAALRVVIVYHASTGVAMASSDVTPIIWTGVLSAWTVGYGTQQRKKGERMVAAGQMPAFAGVPGPAPARPAGTGR